MKSELPGVWKSNGSKTDINNNTDRPKNFRGRPFGVGDVIVINQQGEITAYFVDKDSLVVVAGFIRSSSSGILVTLDTKNLFIDGCAGTWMATEECVVESQRFFLMQHLFGEIVEYVDDGYTGTNFNRPAFQKMIVDLKQGNIKVIMVKDLSRLGRDYIGVGDYIEQIFPLMGVRFIAVNNSFDSMKLNNGTPGIEVAVSNLVNSMYSRDIAKKVRAALETNWKNGKATCTNVPFGYVWNKKGGQRWEIDPEAAASVKKYLN